jgi:hypothetical protein
MALNLYTKTSDGFKNVALLRSVERTNVLGEKTCTSVTLCTINPTRTSRRAENDRLTTHPLLSAIVRTSIN